MNYLGQRLESHVFCVVLALSVTGVFFCFFLRIVCTFCSVDFFAAYDSQDLKGLL